jgi:hypothetical protein
MYNSTNIAPLYVVFTGIKWGHLCEAVHNYPSGIVAGPGMRYVAEPPELFQLKCLSHAPGVVTHLNWDNPSVPQI